MYLVDYHIHSVCSPDADDTMADMARTSFARGVGLLCFTDHCDLDWYETGLPDEHCFDYYTEAKAQFAAAREAVGDSMELRLGVELGEANHDPGRAEKIAASPELDFVLGSLHSLRGEVDFYCLPYESEAHCEKLLHRYLAELTELARLPFVDAIAHIGYTRRYMKKAGYDLRVDPAHYGAELDTLLKAMIETGKALEINTSGLRNPELGETIPCAEVLRRYRSLGGELVTLGSDAHTVADAAGGLREGMALIRDCGFGYLTVFRKRKAEFIKL